MEIKLLTNLILSIIGIIIFCLIRRTEINKKIKIFLFNSERLVIYFRRFVLKFILGLDILALSINEYIFSNTLRKKKNFFKVLKKNTKKERKKLRRTRYNDILYKKLVYKYADKKIENYKSISDILIDKYLKRNDNVMIVMLIYVTIIYNLNFFTNINLESIVFLLLTILIWFILIDQILLIYRNKKGYYGTNYDEAMELICFIKQSSNDDFNTSNGIKVLNEEEGEDTVASGRKVLV